MFEKEFEKGTVIIDRTGKIKGKTTGGTRPCNLEGCRGHKIGVRWEDKTLTWPCTGGLISTHKGWRIL